MIYRNWATWALFVGLGGQTERINFGSFIVLIIIVKLNITRLLKENKTRIIVPSKSV